MEDFWNGVYARWSEYENGLLALAPKHLGKPKDESRRHAARYSTGHAFAIRAVNAAAQKALDEKRPFNPEDIARNPILYQNDPDWADGYDAAVVKALEKHEAGNEILPTKSVKAGGGRRLKEEERQELFNKGRAACDDAEKRAERRAERKGVEYNPLQIRLPKDAPDSRYFRDGFYERKKELSNKWAREHTKPKPAPIIPAQVEPAAEAKPEPKPAPKPAEPASPYSHGYVKPQKNRDPNQPKPQLPPENADWYQMGYTFTETIN